MGVTGEVVVEGEKETDLTPPPAPPPASNPPATISSPMLNKYGLLRALQKDLAQGSVWEQIIAFDISFYFTFVYSIQDAIHVTGTNLAYRTFQINRPVLHLDNTIASGSDFQDAFVETAGLGLMIAGGLVGRVAKVAQGSRWVYGGFKTSTKWANQLAKRGWTEKQITEAITKGKSFKAINNVNHAHPATRYVHPKTGRSVVIDDITNELLHVGGSGFKY